LRNLRIPVCLVWGVDDLTAPLKVAERAVALCPEQIKLQTVPGGHFVAVTSPKLLFESTEALVRRMNS